MEHPSSGKNDVFGWTLKNDPQSIDPPTSTLSPRFPPLTDNQSYQYLLSLLRISYSPVNPTLSADHIGDNIVLNLRFPLLDMSNVKWRSPASSSSTSLILTPGIASTSTTPPSADAGFITEEVHNILFHKEADPGIKWAFLTTKAAFPVSKLLEDKAVVELLLTTEPGPKVDYDRLRTNLTQLQPFVIKTPSGPALLSFFNSLIQLKAVWLIAAAKLEAFRSYDRTIFTYYIEWYEGFRLDTAGHPLDDGEMAYEKECQEHAGNRAKGTYAKQEQQLIRELEEEALKLVTLKTSQDMWKYSRILWTITEQYKCYKQRTKTAAARQKVRDEEMKKRKTEEILRRRAEAKQKNDEDRKHQMGMQQQDANNLFMQQDWMTNYAPAS